MSDRWWTDGAMVNDGLPGEEGFVADAATEDDAQRIVDAHNDVMDAAASEFCPTCHGRVLPPPELRTTP